MYPGKRHLFNLKIDQTNCCYVLGQFPIEGFRMEIRYHQSPIITASYCTYYIRRNLWVIYVKTVSETDRNLCFHKTNRSAGTFNVR